MEENEKRDNSFMMKLATFIVDKHKGFYLIFLVLIFFAISTMNRVKVNNDLTDYLPDSTETRRGIDLMDEQFVTYGSARVMVCNVTYEEAEALSEQIEKMDCVSMLDFDDSEDYYRNMEALFNITFSSPAEDPKAIDDLNQVLAYLDGRDVYFVSDVGKDERDASDLGKDMRLILLMSGFVIVGVLLFTSTTYGEIPVYLITFLTAAILNKGSNFWFGEISFVTNSIAVVLQLALAVDYAIIFAHRFMEEHEDKDAREAVIVALSKAIPEISSSSLTTVAGMVALMFMHFRIGYDMGIILAKAILISLISVFLLMPGLLLSFAELIDKSHHKSFVPKITLVGKFCVLTKHIVPPVLVCAVIASCILCSRAQYVYDKRSIKSSIMSENRFSEKMVNGEFGEDNALAVVVPAGNYETEGKLLRELEHAGGIKSVRGLANIEAMDDYILTQNLTPREFSELLDMDVEVAKLVYAAYAVDKETYGALAGNLSDYKVPLIDMFLFIHDQNAQGGYQLDADLEKDLNDAYDKIIVAKNQLQGEAYSRFILDLDVPIEGEATYAVLRDIRAIAEKYYPADHIYLVGNATGNRDLCTAFKTDNILITVLTALLVMIILLFTFQSAGLPVLLVLTIQGSIWLNFSIPYLSGQSIYFLGYLVVSAIQMGATIDYAIVLTSRYTALRANMEPDKAIIETLNQAFPTIITSGSMMVSAGFIICGLTSNAVVATLGRCIGRGTLTSICLVMMALPQTLLLGDRFIEKTAFTIRHELAKNISAKGKIVMRGHLRGKVNGFVDGEFFGIIDGEVGGTIRSREPVQMLTEEVDTVED